MIIIRFQGGLGNQMFQYALYKELEYLGIEVRADLSRYEDNVDFRSFKLKDIFGIELCNADRTLIENIAGKGKNELERLYRKYVRHYNTYNEPDIDGISSIRKIKRGLLNGFWQSEKWFPDIKMKLYEEFAFPRGTEQFERQCLQAKNENSVSIHIRLGDYLQEKDLYGGICTQNYYVKAVKCIQEKIKNPVYYLISDEPDKALDLLNGIVQPKLVKNDGMDYQDMQFTSCCRHNILANSSFSWWGTWLNRNPEKIVISPMKWNNRDSSEEIFCENWIRISGE